MAPEAIAIIGSVCRFPGGANPPSALWKLLENPRDVCNDIHPDRFDTTGFYHLGGSHHGTTSVRKSSLLQEDLSRRLLLETVYEAFESVGHTIESLQGSDTAIFTGTMGVDFNDTGVRDLNTVPTCFATGAAFSRIYQTIGQASTGDDCPETHSQGNTQPPSVLPTHTASTDKSLADSGTHPLTPAPSGQLKVLPHTTDPLTTSPPDEAATYYESFDKPNPDPMTSSQQQVEQKKSSSGTALKVAAGVVAGAAVAGLVTAAVMNALHESHNDSSGTTTTRTGNDISHEVAGATADPRLETGSVHSIAYASTVDSSDLGSVNGGSDYDGHPEQEYGLHADSQPASSAPTEVDTENQDSDPDHDPDQDIVADSSDFNTDGADSDIDSIADVTHQQESTFPVSVQDAEDHKFSIPQMEPVADLFAYTQDTEQGHLHDENDSVADSRDVVTEDDHGIHEFELHTDDDIHRFDTANVSDPRRA
ncbi:hypothetical protein BJX63DRAFT_438068 [Aspergillus granulosus]|uniref:Ketosynthase family 3 (KS3) domain-containing protein n=1 Tax=Aspergillus granulosus TaxID=176169 RepID=A0ABR4GTA6_9EURO